MPLCSWFCGSLINRVNSLQTQVAQLQSQLAAIRSSNVMALNPFVSVQPTGAPKVVFSGINVQIVNGLGRTDSINGLGNLIIGYDKPRDEGEDRERECSIGGMIDWDDGNHSYQDTRCNAENDPGQPGGKGVMAWSHKNGSHYLIIGDEHNYSQYGGVVFGYHNTSNHRWATVTGGGYNSAGGEVAVTSGGFGNVVEGKGASISGGWFCFVHGLAASVSGGDKNAATGEFASVSGGRYNGAAGSAASVSGGEHNIARGGSGSVSGGNDNRAETLLSSILGGEGQQTTSDRQTIPALP